MTRAEYENIQQQVLLFAGLLNRLPLEEMCNAIAYADALGPILDPTSWNKAADNLDFVRSAANALLKAQGEIRAAFACHPEIQQIGGMELVLQAAEVGRRV